MSPLLTSGLFVAVGGLMMAVAVPLIRRRVPPNPLYGVRVRATLADPDVWYAANAASGRELFALGAVLAVAALIVPLVAGRWAVDVLVGGTIVGTLILAWRANRFANQLLAARQSARPDEARTTAKSTSERS
jgi:hypothetical protein